MEKFVSKPKINLDVLKSLLTAVEAQVLQTDKFGTNASDSKDLTNYILEISKLNGLLLSVVQESTAISNDLVVINKIFSAAVQSNGQVANTLAEVPKKVSGNFN
jgi:hypothetical protein